MAVLIPGLPDLVVLRQAISDALSTAGLLGLYTFADGSIAPAIAVEGLGSDSGEASYPPAGTKVSGLEVAIVPAQGINQQAFLGDDEGVFFESSVVLKQHDFGPNKTLKAYMLLSSLFDSKGAVTRILPSTRLDSIETLTFSLETSQLLEFTVNTIEVSTPGIKYFVGGYFP